MAEIKEAGIDRHYLKDDFEISWKVIENYYRELYEREILSKAKLKQWLKDRSELSAALSENFAWRYIKMNIDTRDEKLKKDFQFFVQKINPKLAPWDDKLNRKFAENEFAAELKDPEYRLLLKIVENHLQLYRDENIPLFTQLEEASQEYGATISKLSVEFEGQEYTLQQAAKLLKDTDRNKRKKVFELIQEQRNSVSTPLNELFDKLLALRQEVAKNAGFDNYRDYKFRAMDRFDYTPEDCMAFHQAVKEELLPLQEMVLQDRKTKLELSELKPYDLAVDPEGRNPLQPFDKGEELLEKTVVCFERLDPFFADCLREMKKRKHLDLESKKGKAPGGFNYPLYESGFPFIFMNAVGTMRDVTTMIHEGGHAVHSVLAHPLELVDFKSTPSEIAELASMSMELLTMDNWDVFFDKEEELNRARQEQLTDVISTLPWVATIDKFQHWLYTHPRHSIAEREEEWLKISEEFSSDLVDWSDYPEAKKNQWQRQLHLFEVPFYYIEYGFAQLGAVALWRNYRKEPEATIKKYKKALSLGYTRSISEVYQAAGIRFDFSSDYIHDLSSFLKEEYIKTKS